MSRAEPLCGGEIVHHWPEPNEEIWHILSPVNGRTDDFHPIKCSKDEGIVLPGPPVRRQPTCPECAGVGS
jgi:hypothetical protein